MGPKITYTLYSAEAPEGVEVAEVTDQMMANILEPYFRQHYNNSAFKVYVKYGRQQRQWLTGSYQQ